LAACCAGERPVGTAPAQTTKKRGPPRVPSAENHGAAPYEDVIVNIEAIRGVREGPIGGRIVVVAIVSVVAVLMIAVLAVALAPTRPPGSILTGTTWQWTGSTTGPAEVPLRVPDPSKYSIEFISDWTFRATADCNTVSGTYRTVSAGRTGLPSTGLRLRPDPYSLAACGPDSMSDAFLQGLWSAARYEIADSQLTILRSTEGTMTFEVGGPAANAPGGARPADEDGHAT
jgi:heat shock protein HslJ